MSTMAIEEVQAILPELIAKLQPGQDLIITQNEHPVARLCYEGIPKRKPRKAGSAAGKLIIVADDEEHLEHFRDYMP